MRLRLGHFAVSTILALGLASCGGAGGEPETQMKNAMLGCHESPARHNRQRAGQDQLFQEGRLRQADSARSQLHDSRILIRSVKLAVTLSLPTSRHGPFLSHEKLEKMPLRNTEAMGVLLERGAGAGEFPVYKQW